MKTMKTGSKQIGINWLKKLYFFLVKSCIFLSILNDFNNWAKIVPGTKHDREKGDQWDVTVFKILKGTQHDTKGAKQGSVKWNLVLQEECCNF